MNTDLARAAVARPRLVRGLSWHLRTLAAAVLVALVALAPAAYAGGKHSPMGAKRRAKQRRRNLVRYRSLLAHQRGLSATARFRSLAADPAHNGHITPNGRREAVVGLKLEKLGQLLGPIVREPTGRSEFIDARGQRWDVKAFNSHFPVRSGGFSLQRAMKKLAGQFAGGENVILDTQNLKPRHEKELRRALAKKGWSDFVLWH